MQARGNSSYSQWIYFGSGPGNDQAGEGKRSKNGDVSDYLRSEIFGATWQQLGLSLKLRRGPVEILVIDHAEKHRRTRDAARCS